MDIAELTSSATGLLPLTPRRLADDVNAGAVLERNDAGVVGLTS